MFTGLVEALGTVKGLTRDGVGCRLVIEQSSLAPELSPGESVAVNGTCLSVVEHDTSFFAFDVGPETLHRTNLGELQTGHRVNLERSVRAGDRLGGHFVQGHVDGLGRIDERREDGPWVQMGFRCPADLAEQMVSKGSVAVDGISLTLVTVEAERFTVMLIPLTLASTTLGFKGVGETVNLETDMLGKLVWKFLQLRPG